MSENSKFYLAVHEDDELLVLYGYRASSEVAFRSNMSTYYKHHEMKVFTDFDEALDHLKCDLYAIIHETFLDEIATNMTDGMVANNVAINFSLYRPKKRATAA